MPKFELPDLPYGHDALEPAIDRTTMEIHHTKHHQGYTDKLNTAVEKYDELSSMSAEELLKNLQDLDVSDEDRTAIRNNGGGYVNHALFWEIMGPEKEIDEDLSADIKEEFGSVEEFKKQFSETASGVFGSGWAWLARDEQGQLHLHGLPNQDSPYLHGHTPVIGLDVWEHAYYLKYQNLRGDYIENWWKVLKLL